MPEQSEPLVPGQTLAGKYEVGDRLAAGGYAVIYMANRLADHVPVAVKALRLDVTRSDPAALERFAREAAIAATLRHPNLVRVLDFGQTRDNVFYMVMERLRGRPLKTLLYKETFPPGRVRHILRQILDALVMAHGQGLVHRDLKPSNVFLCSMDTSVIDADLKDWVKILDFGFAKGIPRAKKAMKTTLTMDGVRVGTPGYMAPEMFRDGQALTPLVDLYTVGLLGYEMLTGRPAFEGKGIDRAVAQLRTDPPEPSGFIGKHPLYAVIRRLIQRDPNDRYPSAEAALRDLESLGQTKGKLWM